MLNFSRPLAVTTLVLLFSGCSSSESKGGDATGGQSGGGGQGGAAAAGGQGGAAGCDPAKLSKDQVCLTDVSGEVMDQADKPVADLDISVCGEVCFFGKTDAQGKFSVSVQAPVVPKDYSTLVHGRPHRASFYYPLPLDAKDNVAVGNLRVIDLPKSGPALTVKSDKLGAPAQSVSSGEVTLSVAQGVEVKLDVEDLVDAAGKQFRAQKIDSKFMSDFADASLKLAGLYALTPFEASIRKEGTSDKAIAQLSFENTLGIKADAKVEFLALGSYLFADWVAPARFSVVATGSVSKDGKTITMDPGSGLNYLTWVGIREKSQ